MVELRPLDKSSAQEVECDLLRLLRYEVNPLQSEPTEPESVDWRLVLELAERQGVTPLLRAAIENAQPRPPSAVSERVRDARHVTRLRNALMFLKVAHIVQEFTRNDIRIVMLKGACLAETLYEDIGLRPMGDIDVLVRLQDLRRASAIVRRCGGETVAAGDGLLPSLDYLWRTVGSRHARWLLPGPPVPVALEAHWNLYTQNFSGLVTYDERDVWAHVRPYSFCDIPVFGLSLEDQFTFLCFGLYKDWVYSGRSSLRTAVDVAKLLAEHGHDMDWQRVLRMCRENVTGGIVFPVVRFAREAFGCMVPREVIEDLRDCSGRRPLGWDLVFTAATPGSEKQSPSFLRMEGDYANRLARLPDVRARLRAMTAALLPTERYFLYFPEHVLPFLGMSWFRAVRGVRTLLLGQSGAATVDSFST